MAAVEESVKTSANASHLLMPLSRSPSMDELQQYVYLLKVKRCFPDNRTKAALSLCIQAGEIANAVRRIDGASDSDELRAHLSRQLADAVIYLLDIANLNEISISESFFARELENSQREWSHYHRSADLR